MEKPTTVPIWVSAGTLILEPTVNVQALAEVDVIWCDGNMTLTLGHRNRDGHIEPWVSNASSMVLSNTLDSSLTPVKRSERSNIIGYSRICTPSRTYYEAPSVADAKFVRKPSP